MTTCPDCGETGLFASKVITWEIRTADPDDAHLAHQIGREKDTLPPMDGHRDVLTTRCLVCGNEFTES